jgi:superfamily II DNA or RNA helicase
LYQQIGLEVLLVLCPFLHLVTQWDRECQKFNLNPILAFDNLRSWQGQLSNQIYNLLAGNQRFITVITTYSTFLTDGFGSQLKYFPLKTLIIGDEAHNLGAPKLVESLPRRLGLRLALSATPERYFDDRGTASLLDYFGPVLQPEFTLGQAIACGALVHYLYYPIPVELTESESFAYLKLTKKIGRSLSFHQQEHGEIGDFVDCEDLKPLLIQRARLIGTAANKLVALRELMTDRRETTHTLFYCGDGSQDLEPDSTTKQLTSVAKILGLDFGYKVSTYTAHTPLTQREFLRSQFDCGELQGLVAIHCLDEGVDIPSVQTAVILASSGNPRQFIQRRGRVLRPHPGKHRATIFDMVVLPPELDRETIAVERNLLKRELRRFVEFADLADNAGEARMKLLALQKKYSLLDL